MQRPPHPQQHGNCGRLHGASSSRIHLGLITWCKYATEKQRGSCRLISALCQPPPTFVESCRKCGRRRRGGDGAAHRRQQQDTMDDRITEDACFHLAAAQHVCPQKTVLGPREEPGLPLEQAKRRPSLRSVERAMGGST